MDSEVILVSGLPRSGTSLMMQMLENGGVDVVTDNVRAADADNPRGYYELERVKRIEQDASWLPDAQREGGQNGLPAALRPSAEREIPDHFHGTGP